MQEIIKLVLEIESKTDLKLKKFVNGLGFDVIAFDQSLSNYGDISLSDFIQQKYGDEIHGKFKKLVGLFPGKSERFLETN